jgi:hypothetical protein
MSDCVSQFPILKSNVHDELSVLRDMSALWVALVWRSHAIYIAPDAEIVACDSQRLYESGGRAALSRVCAGDVALERLNGMLLA